MLSLVGLPLTGGFIAKLQIFKTAMEEGWVWLTIFGVLNSALSVYYYLRVIVSMYMKEGEVDKGKLIDSEKIPPFALISLTLTAFGVVYLGIFPNFILKIANDSINSLFL